MIEDSSGSAAEREGLYRAFFEALTCSSYLLKTDPPRYTVLATTDKILAYSGLQKGDLIGRPLFEVFPSNPADSNDTGQYNLKASLDYVLEHKKLHHLPVQRYDVMDEQGRFIERYWKAENKPVLTPDGEVAFIIHTAEDITQKVKAEQTGEELNKLQGAFHQIESSQKELKHFKFMADHAQDLFVLMRENGTFAYLNQKALDTWGYTEEESKSLSVPQVDPVYQSESYNQLFAKAQSEIIPQFETQHKRKDGTIYPVEVIVNGIVVDGNSYLFAIARDITERKERDTELKQSKERFELVAKATQDAIWDWNLTTNEIWWNEGFKELFGYNEQDIEPDINSWYKRVHPDDKVRVVGGIHEVIDKGGKNWSGEYRFRKKDGSYAIVFDRGYALHNEEGAPCRMLGSMQDITERKQVEEALRESEQRFRIMADTVPQSIWIADNKWNNEFLNKHWWDYSGAHHSETSAADIAAKYLHPDDAPTVMQALARAEQTGEPFEVEQRNLSRHGEYRWFLNRATPYRDPVTGQITKWFGVGIDIHDRKLAEQALRRSEEDLEQKVEHRTKELEESMQALTRSNLELARSNKNLEEFAHAASHDMKEPIRKVLFFTDRLKASLDSRMTETEQGLFSRVEHATKRMGLLIDDLLDFSHVSEQPLEKEEVDLNIKVSRVLTDLELQIDEQDATFHVGQLPVVMGYKRQVQQLFQNLISNAIKYSRPDQPPVVTISSTIVLGKEVQVHVLPEQKDHQFHLVEVRDNGIGFEQAYAEKIFQMFQRLHGKSEYPGTGVGLSIAKKVVENHGGYIWAESERGQGASFKVLLPLE